MIDKRTGITKMPNGLTDNQQCELLDLIKKADRLQLDNLFDVVNSRGKYLAILDYLHSETKRGNPE